PFPAGEPPSSVPTNVRGPILAWVALLSQVATFVTVRGVSASRVDRELASLAPLSDPVRRRLYLYVADQPGDVGRDETARAADITRAAAAFHLERLVDAGLLEGGYRRLSGRRGPGAGRPARIYRRPAQEVRVSVPPRDYELVARFLIRGLRRSRASVVR